MTPPAIYCYAAGVANVSKDMTPKQAMFITETVTLTYGDMKASTEFTMYSGSSLDVDGNMTSDGNT